MICEPINQLKNIESAWTKPYLQWFSIILFLLHESSAQANRKIKAVLRGNLISQAIDPCSAFELEASLQSLFEGRVEIQDD